MDDLPTNVHAQPWFEGARSRRSAARVHAPEAETPPVSAPRFEGSGAAHPRAELSEQVEGCASNHARLGHGKGADHNAEAGTAPGKSANAELNLPPKSRPSLPKG